MNASYGDKFAFGGAAGDKPPFELRTEADGSKKLYYRGPCTGRIQIRNRIIQIRLIIPN